MSIKNKMKNRIGEQKTATEQTFTRFGDPTEEPKETLEDKSTIEEKEKQKKGPENKTGSKRLSEIPENTKETADDKSIVEGEKQGAEKIVNAEADVFVVEKRFKYEDEHIRKTYYIHKKHIKEIEALRKAANLSQSEIVNIALARFFEKVTVK